MRPRVLAVLSLALLAAEASAGNNSTLNVTVRDGSGNPIPGAAVAAIHLNNGPADEFASKVATANAAGVANFSPGNGNALVDFDFYIVVAASQGFLPGIVDQFNNGPASLMATPSASTPSITIGLTAATGIGEIDANAVNASPNALVFGQISLQGGGSGVQTGWALTDPTGSGRFRFYNVAFASAGTYNVAGFESNLNKSASFAVNSNLNAGSPLLGPGGFPILDFNTAPPPITNLSQAQQTGQGGGLSVNGVVTDTTTAANPVPFAQLNFQSQFTDTFGQTRNDWRGASADQNGAFQLYGLLPGVTYYTTIFGGCSQTTGLCYQGSQSTASFGAPPGINDFLYTSSSVVLTPRMQLQAAPPSTGTLAVYVTDQFGNIFPQASMGLFPDDHTWQIGGSTFSCSGSSTASNPGLTTVNNVNATTGYALLTGLPSGNYSLNVWTPYGQSNFSAGPDGIQNYNTSCSSTDVDDLRLAIDTASPLNVKVFDQYGNLKFQGSSVTVVVVVSTGGTGVVQGTLTFPGVVDLSQSPIVMTLYPQCNSNGNCNNSGGGFKTFNAANTGPTVNYSIPVSSGNTYFLSVLSAYWGASYPGGIQPFINLTNSTAAVVNIQFNPAGRVKGYLRKPDGSVYHPPTNSGNIDIAAEGNNAYNNTQLASDGSFTIGGLLPGQYFLTAQSFGSTPFPYTTKQPIPTVTIAPNQDVQQDVYLDNAVTVNPVVSTAALPALSIYSNCSNQGNHGSCPPIDWQVFGLPSGSVFNSALVANLITGGDKTNVFNFSVSTGNFGNCSGASLSQPGWCYEPVPVKTSGSAYDFYVVQAGGFDSQNNAGGARPYFVIENSSRAVVVSQQNATGTIFNPCCGPGGSTITVQNVQLTPSPSLAGTPQATLSGTVTALNFITHRQFDLLGGNFNNFLQYLILAYVYDSTGNLKAVGLTTPFPPNEVALDNQLNQAVSQDNFAAFQTLTGPAPGGWGPVGYEIRGLTAGQTYSLIFTSPNYPPFRTTVTLGAAGSTTTVNVNMDANPGASLAGVVQSTGSAPLLGAQVTVSAPGYTPATLTTDAAGTWRLDGLSAGQYQVAVVAPGYIQFAQLVTVGGSGVVNMPPIRLPASNASISGTVYTNNPICPAGVICSAFGKTVLQGIPVFAYDDTLNVINPSADLTLYRAVTNASGVYVLQGLQSGESYKVFANAPGYFVVNQTTLAVAGPLTGFDFSLTPKPLDVNVFGRPVGTNYEFQITNFRAFSTGHAWIGVSPFVKANSTDVSNGFTQKPDSQGVIQLVLDFPLSNLASGTVYVLHVEGQPNDPHAPLVTKEITFGLNIPNNACQNIDQSLVGDNSNNASGLPQNQVPLDLSGGTGGNGTGVTLPAGGLIPILSTSVPSNCISQTDSASSPFPAPSGWRPAAGGSSPYVSGIYQLSFSSINYTSKGFDITLAYDKTQANLSDMAIYHFNAGNQQWEMVPGQQIIDPVQGTISILRVKSLASVLGKDTPRSLLAVNDGKSYRPNGSYSTLAITDSGAFAVLRPSVVGSVYAGTTIKVFNFPNPFNLSVKTLNLANGGGTPSITTSGTVIKVELPAGISGEGYIRIYTIAGELVRELDLGSLTGGSFIYTQWDGKNRTGVDVANGVYYGILSIPGIKAKDATFKMAVVK